MNPRTFTALEEPLPVLQSTTGKVTSCGALAGGSYDPLEVGGPLLVQLFWLLQLTVVRPPFVALIRASIALVMDDELPELPDFGVIQSPTSTEH